MGNKYEFGLDIINDVLDRAAEPTYGNGSSYEDAAKRYIYREYLKILRDRPWLGSVEETPKSLSLVGEETGTATITNGSTSVTLGATIATSMAGRKFKIDNESIVYRISAHIGGTSAVTLDAAYTEDDVTSGAFTIFQDEYDLDSSVLEVWRFKNRNNIDEKIEIVPADYLAEHYGDLDIRATTNGKRLIARIAEQRIRVVPWTENAETLEYEYTKIPAEFDYSGSGSSDTPALELAMRSFLADRALMHLLFDKNDNRYAAHMRRIDDDEDDHMAVHHARRKGRSAPHRNRAVGVRRRCR